MKDNQTLLSHLLQNYASPYDERTSEFFILINENNQQSLWPSLIDIPDGWIKKFGPATREECLMQTR